MSADRKAQDLRLDRRFFGLDRDKYQELVARLDAPPAPNEKLRKLLTRRSPWD